SAVAAPKTAGARNLDRVLAGFNPDFVVYCSSLAVVLGGLGQCAYVAANAGLDALARASEGPGYRPTIAIAWDRWREAGMGAAIDDPDAIRLDEGARVFDAALSAGLPEIAVSTRDLRARRGEPIVPAARAVQAHPRPALSTDFVKPSTGPESMMA